MPEELFPEENLYPESNLYPGERPEGAIMSIPTGLAAQIGVRAETTYGEFKTPNAFYEFDSQALDRNPNYLTSTGLRAGRLAAPAGRHKPTTRTPGGDVPMKWANKGMGTLVNLLHGETVVPTKIGTSTAYKQLHVLGVSWPEQKSLTLQAGVPGVDGVVVPYSYTGSMVNTLALSCATGAELMATWSMIAQDQITAEPLAVANYPTNLTSLDFVGGKIQLNEDVLGIIPSANITLPLALKPDRFGLGSGAIPAKPMPIDYFKPTGAVNMEFKGLTMFEHFRKCDNVKFVFEFTGAVISEGIKETLKVTLPACHFTSGTPQVSGPDIVALDWQFEAFDNGSEAPATIEIIAVDTAI